MLLNRIEFAVMNNPLRAVIQRHFEARMGGPLDGGRAPEMGCGGGVSTLEGTLASLRVVQSKKEACGLICGL